MGRRENSNKMMFIVRLFGDCAVAVYLVGARDENHAREIAQSLLGIPFDDSFEVDPVPHLGNGEKKLIKSYVE